MKRERRFLRSEVPSSIRDDSGTKKADIPKERWTVESSAPALKSGLDFPVIDPIIFNLAPISFAFPPFLPFIPTTQNRDFVLIQIGEGHFLVRVDVFHGEQECCSETAEVIGSGIYVLGPQQLVLSL